MLETDPSTTKDSRFRFSVSTLPRASRKKKKITKVKKAVLEAEKEVGIPKRVIDDPKASLSFRKSLCYPFKSLCFILRSYGKNQFWKIGLYENCVVILLSLVQVILALTAVILFFLLVIPVFSPQSVLWGLSFDSTLLVGYFVVFLVKEVFDTFFYLPVLIRSVKETARIMNDSDGEKSVEIEILRIKWPTRDEFAICCQYFGIKAFLFTICFFLVLNIGAVMVLVGPLVWPFIIFVVIGVYLFGSVSLVFSIVFDFGMEKGFFYGIKFALRYFDLTLSFGIGVLLLKIIPGLNFLQEQLMTVGATMIIHDFDLSLQTGPSAGKLSCKTEVSKNPKLKQKEKKVDVLKTDEDDEFEIEVDGDIFAYDDDGIEEGDEKSAQDGKDSAQGKKRRRRGKKAVIRSEGGVKNIKIGKLKRENSMKMQIPTYNL